jgi:hypothetical protein
MGVHMWACGVAFCENPGPGHQIGESGEILLRNAGLSTTLRFGRDDKSLGTKGTCFSGRGGWW